MNWKVWLHCINQARMIYSFSGRFFFSEFHLKSHKLFFFFTTTSLFQKEPVSQVFLKSHKLLVNTYYSPGRMVGSRNKTWRTGSPCFQVALSGRRRPLTVQLPADISELVRKWAAALTGRSSISRALEGPCLVKCIAVVLRSVSRTEKRKRKNRWLWKKIVACRAGSLSNASDLKIPRVLHAWWSCVFKHR